MDNCNPKHYVLSIIISTLERIKAPNQKEDSIQNKFIEEAKEKCYFKSLSIPSENSGGRRSGPNLVRRELTWKSDLSSSKEDKDLLQSDVTNQKILLYQITYFLKILRPEFSINKCIE